MRAVAFTLAVLGAAAFGMSLWIEAKARFAQALLQRAWARTLDGEAAVKPWPWADTWPVAKLTIASRNASVIVLSGASGRTMAFGPGHVDGTAAPGMSGNCVITAHRDTHFAALRDVAQGDIVEIQSPDGGIRRYAVRRTFVAGKNDTWLLDGGEDRLTLITCWPFDAIAPGSPLRWVVEADPVQNVKATGVSQRPLDLTPQ